MKSAALTLQIQTLPEEPGVYQYFDKNTLNDTTFILLSTSA